MNVRDYGLPDPKPVGKPRIDTSVDPTDCPNCGGESTVFACEVEVEMATLKGGKGVAYYMGCAACPWASPSVTVAK